MLQICGQHWRVPTHAWALLPNGHGHVLSRLCLLAVNRPACSQASAATHAAVLSRGSSELPPPAAAGWLQGQKQKVRKKGSKGQVLEEEGSEEVRVCLPCVRRIDSHPERRSGPVLGGRRRAGKWTQRHSTRRRRRQVAALMTRAEVWDEVTLVHAASIALSRTRRLPSAPGSFLFGMQPITPYAFRPTLTRAGLRLASAASCSMWV